MTDEAHAAWNADARSRAQTRGMLMALSRDRAAYFIRNPARHLSLSVATFGLAPLLRRSRRFILIERLEWSELLEVASWLASYTRNGNEAGELHRQASRWLADSHSKRRESIVAAAILLTGVALIAALSLPSRGESLAAETLSFAIASWRVFLAYVAVAFFVELWFINRHCSRSREWIRSLNRLFIASEKRPIEDPRASWLPIWAVGVLAIVQLFTAWPVVLASILITRLAVIHHLREARKIGLRLIERLLEYMDDTGLPVEYDVVALNPDEIAAMMV